MRPVFHRKMTIRQVAILAIQAVSAAKSYDESCGGDTQFMVIQRSGSISPVIPYDVKSVESHIGEFEKLARELLFELGDFSGLHDRAALNATARDARFEAKLGKFVEECRRIRMFWRGEGFSYLSGLLEKLIQEDRLGPQSITDDSLPQPPSPVSPGGSDES